MTLQLQAASGSGSGGDDDTSGVVVTLRQELDSCRHDAESMRRAMSRQEAEVVRLREQLDESQQVLRHREQSMQVTNQISELLR